MEGNVLAIFASAAAGLFAVVGGLAVAGFALQGRAERIRRQIERITTSRRKKVEAPFVHRLFVAFGRRLLWRRRDFRELSQLTQSAGLFSVVAPYQFVTLQACAAIAFAVLGAFVAKAAAVAAPGDAISTFAAGTVGYFLPRLGLRFAATRRLRAIRREIPFFIDMLLLLLRSGAGIERCFREIEQLGAEAVPETHRTIKLMIGDLDQGRSYDTVLDRWATRMSDPSAGEIARQLQQAMKHGTELSRTLSQFAHRLIEHRLANAREKAGRRSTHMTVATLLFLMPPLFIVLAAPGFSNLFRLLSGN